MKDTQLKYALAAWKELSFTGAAEKLNISQSAISQQISLLEREIGFTIFDRVGNGIKPSYKGGLFLIQADQALSSINNLSNIAQQLNGEFNNFVSLGFSSNVTDILLQAIINKIKKAFPGSGLNIITGTTRRIHRMVFQGRLDIGFTFDVDKDLVPPNLEFKQVTNTELYLALYPTHRLAKYKLQIELSELQKEPLIVNEPDIGLGVLIEKFLKKAGIVPRVVATSDNIHSSIMLVRNGLGIILIPSIHNEAETLFKGVILKQTKSQFELPIISVHREGSNSKLDQSNSARLYQLF